MSATEASRGLEEHLHPVSHEGDDCNILILISNASRRAPFPLSMWTFDMFPVHEAKVAYIGQPLAHIDETRITSRIHTYIYALRKTQYTSFSLVSYRLKTVVWTFDMCLAQGAEVACWSDVIRITSHVRTCILWRGFRISLTIHRIAPFLDLYYELSVYVWTQCKKLRLHIGQPLVHIFPIDEISCVQHNTYMYVYVHNTFCAAQQKCVCMYRCKYDVMCISSMGNKLMTYIRKIHIYVHLWLCNGGICCKLQQ